MSTMFIVRSFFGGELMAIAVTPAASLEAAKANFLAWCDPRMEAITIEPCGLGQEDDGTFWAVQDGYAVAMSKNFIDWEAVDEEYDGGGLEWSTVVDRIIC